MKKTAVALAALIALAAPELASGQVSIGARAGTLGLGGEVSFGFTRMIAVRGGIGLVPYEFDGEFSEVTYTVSPPERIWNVGVDVYPFGGGLRLSAGMLNRPAFELVAEGQRQAEISGQTYQGDINIQGEITNEKETAPYATIGFGRATGRGLGFFIDAGAAFMGEGQMTLTGTCTVRQTGDNCPSNFQAELNEEADQAEEDFGGYVKLWPILNIGIRFGF